MSDTLLAQTARAILSAALASPFGTVVHIQPTSDLASPALRAKQVLYRFKKENADFAQIQIKFAPDSPNTRLWLVKTN